MGGLVRLYLGICCLLVLASSVALPQQIYQDTPSPPVILEEGEQYNDRRAHEYTDYEYSSLPDIHTRLFTTKEVNTSDESGPSNLLPDDSNQPQHESRSLDYGPIGVEITAVVSHSPYEEEDEEQDGQDEHDRSDTTDDNRVLVPSETWNHTAKVDNQPSLISKEKVEDLSLLLSWWQMVLLVCACLLLTLLCCYFSGCCFLLTDCCSDPYWGCCPCCRSCVRLTKPPPHGGESKKVEMKGVRKGAPTTSSYSLNENNTAPRASIDRNRHSTSLSRLERASSTSRSIITPDKRPNSGSKQRLSAGSSSGALGVGGGGLKTSTPIKPERRPSRASIRNSLVQSAQDDSLASTNSTRSMKNYRRLSQTNSFSHPTNQTQHTTTTTGQGSQTVLGRTNSLADQSVSGGGSSGRQVGRADDSLRRSRKASMRSEPYASQECQDWVYEDSSGYFSWISKLGSKKRQYQIHPNKIENSSQNNIYRQSKYRHIAESRNSAVIPVKISKRASNASNYNVRPTRCRSVESMTSDEESMEPFLQTKSERHLPSRLSTNLADLETRRNRRQSGGSMGCTPVSCPTVPEVQCPDPIATEAREHAPARPRPGPDPTYAAYAGGLSAGVGRGPPQDYNLKYFEKSLLTSRETTL